MLWPSPFCRNVAKGAARGGEGSLCQEHEAAAVGGRVSDECRVTDFLCPGAEAGGRGRVRRSPPHHELQARPAAYRAWRGEHGDAWGGRCMDERSIDRSMAFVGRVVGRFSFERLSEGVIDRLMD